jgi:hypothetical protein
MPVCTDALSSPAGGGVFFVRVRGCCVALAAADVRRMVEGCCAVGSFGERTASGLGLVLSGSLIGIVPLSLTMFYRNV